MTRTERWEQFGAELAAATKEHIVRVLEPVQAQQRAHEIQIALLESQVNELLERLKALEDTAERGHEVSSAGR
jgi:hypothetical protein